MLIAEKMTNQSYFDVLLTIFLHRVAKKGVRNSGEVAIFAATRWQRHSLGQQTIVTLVHVVANSVLQWPLFALVAKYTFCHSVSEKALFRPQTEFKKQPLWHWPPGTQSSAAKSTFRPAGTKSSDFVFFWTKFRNFKFCTISTTQNNSRISAHQK